MILYLLFCFKQKTAYEMRISDWSSDVCSSDLSNGIRSTSDGSSVLSVVYRISAPDSAPEIPKRLCRISASTRVNTSVGASATETRRVLLRRSPRNSTRRCSQPVPIRSGSTTAVITSPRSDEHTSELQSLMRISYAVFCLKQK